MSSGYGGKCSNFNGHRICSGVPVGTGNYGFFDGQNIGSGGWSYREKVK